MNKNLQKCCIIISLIAFLSLVYAGLGSANADTSLVVLGDIGCKSTAKTNLNNIAKTELPMLGVGDYLYKCSPSDVQKNWDAINTKHGVYGNHDVESSKSTQFTKNIMGISDKGWFTWTMNRAEIAIIGINVYKDYEEGSAQYAYIKAKSDLYCNRVATNWVIYTFHEPIHTPTVDGGHGLNNKLRSVMAPVIQDCGNKALVLVGHNHITSFGNVDGMNQAMCGGGGAGGDSIDKLNGWEFGTTTPGYCSLRLEPDSANIQLIGTDGSIKGSHTYSNAE